MHRQWHRAMPQSQRSCSPCERNATIRRCHALCYRLNDTVNASWKAAEPYPWTPNSYQANNATTVTIRTFTEVKEGKVLFESYEQTTAHASMLNPTGNRYRQHHTRCRTRTMTINAAMQHRHRAYALAAVPCNPLTISAFQPVIQEVLVSQDITEMRCAAFTYPFSTCCA